MHERAEDIQVATAVIIILSGSHRSHSQSDFYFDGVSMSRDRAVETLALLPKPLFCRAETQDGHLAISTERVRGTILHHDWRATHPITMAPDLEENNHILVSTAEDSIRLNKQEFSKLLNDYRLVVPPSLAGDWPSPAESARGAIWELRVGNDSEQDASADVPEEVQAIIRSMMERGNPPSS